MQKEKELLIIEIIKECYSISDVCKKLAVSITNGNYITIKKVIDKHKVDITHFKRCNFAGFVKKLDISEILIENSTYGSTKLKYRLLSEKFKEPICEICGNSEWMGDKIPLHLHHKNGIHNDNRLENLQILCPNCHAKTENYGSKNINGFNKTKRTCAICGKEITNGNKKCCSIDCYIEYKIKNESFTSEYLILKSKNFKTLTEFAKFLKKDIETVRNICKRLNCLESVRENLISNKKSLIKPDKTELINKFKTLVSFSKVGENYGVSDNAVRKWCKSYDIPTKSKDMVQFLK